MESCSAEIKQCAICSQSIFEPEEVARTVKAAGLRTIRRISLQKKDCVRIKIPATKIVSLFHQKCYTSYLKPIPVKKTVADQPPKKILRTSDKIAFEDLCFFCDEDASDEFLQKQIKRPPKYRQSVCTIINDDTPKKILEHAKKVYVHEMGKKIVERLAGISNLLEKKARYHRKCYTSFFKLPSLPPSPLNEKLPNITKFIVTYIEEVKDKNQFSLKDLILLYKSENPEEKDFPHIRYIKEQILMHCKDDICITSFKNEECIIYRSEITDEIMLKHFKSKSKTDEESRAETIELSAEYIYKDIKNKVYNTTVYPPVDEFFLNLEKYVPDSLLKFVSTLICRYKKGENKETWKKKVMG